MLKIVNKKILMLCPQYFHNKSYVTVCYLLLLVGNKVISVVNLN